MNVGDQLNAPNGFYSLKKDVRYSFLKSCKTTKLVTLVEFTTQKKGRRVHVQRLDRDLFEKGLLFKDIVVAEKQFSLPPWLESIEGADLDQLDLDRADPKKTHRERAEQRYDYIHDLLPQIEDILAAKNPFTLINLHAKEIKPRQNRTRLAEWFFAYACFGRRLIVLYPEFLNIGLWKRDDTKYFESFLGRESLSKGRKHGYASAQFSENIAKAYRKRIGLGKTLKSIYIESLAQDWGCHSRMDKNGAHEMYHPKGLPFPNTYGKFRYQVIKKYGAEQVQKALYGEARVRAKMAASKGTYTQEVANLMEQFEADGYFLKERAKSVFSDEPMPRLCVVRGVCGGSKNVVGIGFSLEGEAAEAYRAMLFSTAIPKDKFAKLFGLDGSILDWPCQGLPPHPISDRGSAPVSAIISNLQAKFPVKEMTESYAGQSKPSVESAHPRDVHIEGPPTFVLSDHNLIQMVQHEICRAALDNHTSYVGNQILGARVGAEVFPSPYALWKHLDSLGRNDAIAMPFDDAVRNFLTPTVFSLQHDGVWIENRCFHSKILDKTGTRDKVAPGQSIQVYGYTLSMCLLFAWIEVDGKLIELEQKLPYRDGKHEKLVTMADIRLEAEKKRGLDSAYRTSSEAARVEAARLFEQATDAKWSSGSRQRGQPKKNTKTTRIETALFKPTQIKKKAA